MSVPTAHPKFNCQQQNPSDPTHICMPHDRSDLDISKACNSTACHFLRKNVDYGFAINIVLTCINLLNFLQCYNMSTLVLWNEVPMHSQYNVIWYAVNLNEHSHLKTNSLYWILKLSLLANFLFWFCFYLVVLFFFPVAKSPLNIFKYFSFSTGDWANLERLSTLQQDTSSLAFCIHSSSADPDPPPSPPVAPSPIQHSIHPFRTTMLPALFTKQQQPQNMQTQTNKQTKYHQEQMLKDLYTP